MTRQINDQEFDMKKALLSFALLAAALPVWAGGLPPVEVWKSPTCGCCVAWIEHMRANGFTVRIHDTDDVAAQKRRLGVPYAYGSCHTAEVGGYLVEGHVPAAQVKRLLAERPQARGLIVPGMPGRSPGMEGQSDHNGPYEVLLLGRNADVSRYAHY
jgi:hypothetical protein